MFRKNPVMVEAVQFAAQNVKECVLFIGENRAIPAFVNHEPVIDFNEKQVLVGDWLVKEADALFVVKPDVFEKEYHPVRGPKTVKDKVSSVGAEISINAMDMMSMPEKEPETRGRKK